MLERVLDWIRATRWPQWYGAGLCLLVGAVGVWHAWSAPPDPSEGFATIGVGTRLLSTLVWGVSSVGLTWLILRAGRRS